MQAGRPAGTSARPTDHAARRRRTDGYGAAGAGGGGASFVHSNGVPNAEAHAAE